MVPLLQAGCPFQTLTSFQKRHCAAIPPLSGDGIARFQGGQREGTSKEPGKSDENNAPRKEGGRTKRDIEGGKEGRREGGSARRKLHGKSPPPFAAALKEAFPCTDDRVGDQNFPPENVTE